jgi:phage regulator Rha-like protein
MTTASELVPAQRIIEGHILLLRGHRVMLSTDLARLYGVQPRTLVQAVKRNVERFPDDFMFRLTWDETQLLRAQPATSSQAGATGLRSQTVILERGRYAKYPPYAFTEQGVAMLSSVLRSKQAVQVNIEIVRAFVRLRRIIAANADLARKLTDLERKYDTQFQVVFDAIRRLMQPPEPRKRRIGFMTDEDKRKPTDFLARDRAPRKRR